MANGNLGYGEVAGSQTVVLPPFGAFGTEIAIAKKWENVWLRALPLLAMIKDGSANWNKGGDVNGTQMLIPIAETDMSTPAAGVSIANEMTAITPFATSGATQASYRIAHYRGAFYVQKSEQILINNQRGNFMDMKVSTMLNSFANAMANDLASANADSDSAILGIQQALSTTNTVGGISQSTDSDWQSNVQATVGAFSLDILDNGIDAVTNRNGKTQLILLAYSSSNNLFSKLRANISPNERLVNQEFSAKYGYTNIQYLENTCVSDGRLTSGVIIGVDPSTWFFQGQDQPQLDHVQAVTGTDTQEHLYYLYAGVGCSNPAKSFRITGAV